MNKNLNIVILTAVNPIRDSGGLIYDIYKSLSKAGHSVIIIARKDDKNFNSDMKSLYSKNRFFRILQSGSWKRRFLKFNTKKAEDRSYYMSLKEKQFYFPTKKILSKIPFDTDLFLYVHPHSFLCSRNLYELNKQTGAPIFNIPVDMAAFTGGCHYANECTRYKLECGCCPGLHSNKKYDASYETLNYKRKYISQTEIYLLSNEWTLKRAKQSSLYSNKLCLKLDIVINETLFKPLNKIAIRGKYNIPDNKSLILFGAVSVNEKRKGLNYLQDALRKLQKEMSEKEKNNTLVVVMGNLQENIKDSILFETLVLGYIQPECLPEIYSMADVYVSPSIQDAGPMMVVQSMMCGTPVVAFEMGNAEDFIIDGETGYKAPLYNTDELKNRIRLLLSKTKKEKKEMNENCRNIALSKSSYVVFSSRIMEIFDNIKIR
jgi:glycosyltransferase involved in cell wall biosynthesis